MPSLVSIRLKIALVVAVAIVTAACGTEDAPGPLEPCTPFGRVRFVNLITDAARNPVNAILEDDPFGVNLAYGGTTPASLPAPSTALYSAVCAGDRTIVLQRTANTSVTVATLPFTVAGSTDYTVFATGGTSGGQVTGFVSTDDNATAPAAGQTRLRVRNMSPTAGAIDVFLTTATADLATAMPIATNIAHQAASAYVNLAPGTYRFRAVPQGTAPAARSASVTIDVSGIVLAANTGRTIVAADNAAGSPTPPFSAFVYTDR
jgi:Domain of unknown function (DUF4397)